MSSTNQQSWPLQASLSVPFLCCFSLLTACLPPVAKNVEPVQLSDQPTATAFVHQAIFDIDGFADNITEEASEGLTILKESPDDYGLFEEYNLSPTFHAVPVTASAGGSYALTLSWEVDGEIQEVEEQIEFAEASSFAIDLHKWFPGAIETGPITYYNSAFVQLLMLDEAGSVLSGRGEATLLKNETEVSIVIQDIYNHTYQGNQANNFSIRLPNEQVVAMPSSEGVAADEITSDWQLTVAGTSTESVAEADTMRHSLHFGLRLPDGRPYLHDFTDIEVVGPDHVSGTFADDNGSALRAIDGIDNDGASGCYANFRYDPQLETEHQLLFCLGAACTEVALKGRIETTEGATDCPW